MYKPFSLNEIPRYRSRSGRRILDVEAFIASGDPACEIVLEPGEKAYTVSGTFRQTIQRRQYYRDAIESFTRDGRVFLVRKEANVDERCR